MNIDRSGQIFLQDRVYTQGFKSGSSSSIKSASSVGPTTVKRTGTGCPGWRKKIKNGENATTNLDWSNCELLGYSAGSINVDWFSSFYQKDAFDRVDGAISHINEPFGPGATQQSLTAVDNQALRKFLNRIQAYRTQFQGMIFFGEGHKTLAMIRNPAAQLRQGISQYLRSLSKGPKLTKTQLLRVAANTWLEMAYGWKPLIFDIESGIKAYSSLGKKIQTREIKSSYKDDLSGSSSQSSVAVGGFCYAKQTSTQHTTGSVKYYGKIKDSVSVLPDDHIMRHFGFTPEQFIPTLWELTPWSFLVDYFTNIGEILDAAATFTSDLAWSSKTMRVENITTRIGEVDYARCQTAVGPEFRDATGDTGHVSYRRVDGWRRMNPSLAPTFQVRCPGMSTRWINMAALAVQQSSVRRFHNL